MNRMGGAGGGAVALGGALKTKVFSKEASMGDLLKMGATQRHRATPTQQEILQHLHTKYIYIYC